MAKGPAKKAVKKPVKPVAKSKPSPKPKAAAAKPKQASAPAPAKAGAKPSRSAHQPPRQYTPPPPPPAPIAVVHAPSKDAVSAFEQGMSALQRHDYKAAAASFKALLNQYPAEGFLTDRSRVYLELAERELRRQPASSGNIEQRLTAATLALNNYNDIEAARLAAEVLKDDSSQDLAEYLLAVVASRGGDVETALGHLRTAIKLNPECRLQARQDEEFDPLMDSDEFHVLIEPPSASAEPAPAAPMRKPVRKTGR